MFPISVGQFSQVQEEALFAFISQQLIVDDDNRTVLITIKLDVLGCEFILVLVPAQYVADGTAVGRVLVPFGL